VSNRVFQVAERLRVLWKSDVAITIAEWLAVCLTAIFGLAAFIYPFVRAFKNVEINRNEGWNVYNAATVAHHGLLYGVKYGWTSVNYPFLSFYLTSWLAHVSGSSYLRTGRVVSLLALGACCAMAGLVVARLGGGRRAAWLTAFLSLAIFCAAGTGYVGMDDPQMLGMAFALGGLLVYVSGKPTIGRLAIVVLLFVVAGNIKQNLVEFPLAVFLDLAVGTWRRALQFIILAALLVGASIGVNILVGGPFFVTNILAPRAFSIRQALGQFLRWGVGPVQVALCLALAWTAISWRSRTARVAIILLWVSLFVGLFFGGGEGVWINAYFDMYLALAIVCGLATNWAWSRPLPARAAVAFSVAPVLLISLACTLSLEPHFRLAIKGLAKQEQQFRGQVEFLRSIPGPALCQSLLTCYEAGKPYLYDTFNATSLLKFHRLSAQPLLDAVDRRSLAEIQFDHPIEESESEGGLFTPAILAAIQRHYKLAYSNSRCYIYVPTI
jgi:hypothetical protein